MTALLAAVLLQTPDQINLLERVDQAELAVFGLKDDGGRTMDCLKVAETAPGSYLGVYHTLIDGSFKLQIAESKDLRHWTRTAVLEDHAHQGTIRKWDQGWLLAWEKDGGEGNWIRVATYATLAYLHAGKPAKVKDLPRSLSKYAEGTPSIFTAFDYGRGRSEIRLRFHFYRDGDVDRQAAGVLTDFDRWEEGPVNHANELLGETYHGNIGDRDEVATPNGSFELIECQKVKNDWASWRIVASYMKGYRELAIKTPKGSTSFANPNCTLLADGRTVMTLFLPSQGAALGEGGCLLYTVRFKPE
jgi:hypothetical protein